MRVVRLASLLHSVRRNSPQPHTHSMMAAAFAKSPMLSPKQGFTTPSGKVCAPSAIKGILGDAAQSRTLKRTDAKGRRILEVRRPS